MKEPVINKHGDKKFDKDYFAVRYKKYDKKEFIRTYRSVRGWMNFIEKYFKIGSIKDKKVLEVGCALGGFAQVLYEKGASVTASDTSAFIIEKAKKLNPKIKFFVCDIEKNIKSTDNEFDIIFSLEVMEHLANPQKALRNLKRKLKPGGVLIFTTPYLTKRTTSDPTHISVKQPEAWIKLGQKLKFKNLKFKYATFVPFLYRFSSFLSIVLPIKTDLPIIGYTCFFYFRK